LKDIPTEIQFCKQIRVINLSKNLFTTVPKLLCTVTTLKKLNLASNMITKIPNEFSMVRTAVIWCFILDLKVK